VIQAELDCTRRDTGTKSVIQAELDCTRRVIQAELYRRRVIQAELDCTRPPDELVHSPIARINFDTDSQTISHFSFEAGSRGPHTNFDTDSQTISQVCGGKALTL
jgi:hypothetical protein